VKKKRVLIVDDSAAMRQLLSAILKTDPSIEVVGVAGDPFIARDKIKSLAPDVITLDVEMPRMDGLTFLEKLMRAHPMPVVMISSLTQRGCETTLRALELGAVDFVAKPQVDTLDGVRSAAEEIIGKVKAAADARVCALKSQLGEPSRLPAVHSLSLTHKVIAIGASTGGTEAIREILVALPANSPGVVVVQHMPPGFTRSFAERLNGLCEIRVKEAADGDRILQGHALIAPGDYHTSIVQSGAVSSVSVTQTQPVNRHRPSVDVLFDSCSRELGPNVVGAILTGMGADGAEGMRRMREAGARTIAQDRDSCVVFGMPKEAIAAGGAEFILPLDRIAEKLLDLAA
jgi:two-component system chemotaxis response regulator CheB